jgi:hypothetical protein
MLGILTLEHGSCSHFLRIGRDGIWAHLVLIDNLRRLAIGPRPIAGGSCSRQNHQFAGEKPISRPHESAASLLRTVKKEQDEGGDD